ERMPVADGHPEVVLHPLPKHEPVGVVHLEGKWIGGFGSVENNGVRQLGEEDVAHAGALLP
ncbi:MAG: hypothetical protein ACXW15_13185, partial [Acidimicrobiia bacterium]